VESGIGHSLRFYAIAAAMTVGVAGMWYDGAIDWGDGPPPTSREISEAIPSLAARNGVEECPAEWLQVKDQVASDNPPKQCLITRHRHTCGPK
jgi:hypothetical protein